MGISKGENGMKVLRENNIETLDGNSMDVVADNIEKLRGIFPEVFCEDKIDFEKLQEVLGNYIENKEERYRFEWNGKSQAIRIAQTPSTGTLRPCKEESKNWDTTQNLYIEGDNLEVLKLLQKSYQNKIKIIYIDPPYNTGRDFVYKDDFRDNIKNYMLLTGQANEKGSYNCTNSELGGRYHTEWLNMIYPRIRIARNLLADDGIIFVSIDDNEVDNLSKILDEVFGEDNLIVKLVRKTSAGEKTAKPKINKHNDYILCYCKDIKLIQDNEIIRGYEKEFSEYSNPDNDSNGDWKKDSILIKIDNGRYGYARYPITNPYLNITHYPPVYYNEGDRKQWHYVKETFDKLVKDKKVVFYKNKEDYTGEYSFYIKKYKSEINDKYNNLSSLNYCSNEYTNTNGTKDISKLFDKGEFDNIYPKPVILIEDLISRVKENENAIIMDFFSGSATTAEAVMNLNLDGGTRKYIMVQIPQLTIGESKYKNICEIGKERIRRAGEKILAENKDKDGIEDLDIGFKVLKLDSSNIKKWNPDYNNLEQSFDDMLDNFVPNRTEEDIVYEIMLKYGIDLTYTVEEMIINGKKVFSVGFGALIICLDNNITLDVIEGIVEVKKELSPEVCRIVFRDNGFANDSVKTNAIQILRRNSIKEIMSI